MLLVNWRDGVITGLYLSKINNPLVIAACYVLHNSCESKRERLPPQCMQRGWLLMLNSQSQEPLQELNMELGNWGKLWKSTLPVSHNNGLCWILLWAWSLGAARKCVVHFCVNCCRFMNLSGCSTEAMNMGCLLYIYKYDVLWCVLQTNKGSFIFQKYKYWLAKTVQKKHSTTPAPPKQAMLYRFLT